MLDRIEEALPRAGVHRSASASKLGRVLADRIPAAPPRPVADAGRDARATWCSPTWPSRPTPIHATDPQVRRDAPEGVHDMRVACRRMRSALQSFRALLDRSRTDDLVAELRWLAGELGGARDLEVQEERIAAASRRCRPSSRSAPVAAQTTRFFATPPRRGGAPPPPPRSTATATSPCSTPWTRCSPTRR